MELFVTLVNLLALCAAIAGLLLGGWFVLALYGVHTRAEEKELPEEDLPAHLHEKLTGVPPALIVFYAFIGIMLIAYLLFVWLGGVTY